MYGHWGKHLETFEAFKDFRADPRIQEAFAEDLDDSLQEAGRDGAPEGRVSFPIYLQTVIRHRIRERFRNRAAQWQGYVGFENAQDFRETTVSQLNAIRGFDGVEEHGEYPRLRSSEEEGPPFAVGKHGGIYGVTYELVINDEQDRILNRIPRELGRSAAEYQNQIVVAFIESNPTYIDGTPFFHASRGNEVTGALATPSEDNLATILDTMATRRDADGMPIIIEPKKLLVRNPSTKWVFDRILRSTNTGVRQDADAVGAPTFKEGNINPLAGVLPANATMVDPWLSDANDWYVLADADDRPAFVVAYLRNRRAPSIFLNDPGMRGIGGGGADPYTMDFDEIPYKLRHVFGVSQGEPLAAVRARP